MRARVGAGLMLALALGIASLSGAPVSKSESTYHGKTAKQWAELLKDKDPKIRRRAVVHLGLAPFGKAAVPALVKALKDEDNEVVEAAIYSLGLLGRDAADAVPALDVLLKETDKETSREILSCLGRIGPAGVPILIEVLESGPAELHDCVCSALGDIGPEAKEAIDALIAVLKTPKDDAHTTAAFAMAAIGEPALAKLLVGVKDPKWSATAIRVIGKMGPKAKKAVPLLVEALKDPNEDVSREAVWALCDLKEFPSEETGQLIQAIAAGKNERYWVEEDLARLGKKAVPALEEALKHPDGKVRAIALNAIHQIDPRSLGDLIKALHDDAMREEATYALQYYASDLKTTMPVLKEAFKDKDEKIRLALLNVVKRFDGKDEKIEFLTAALADTDENVQRAAVSALGSMGSRAKKAIPALTALLIKTRSFIFEGEISVVLGIECLPFEVIKALLEIEPGEKSAVVALCKALGHPHAQLRRRAATLLGDQGEQAKSAILPLAIVFLRDTGTVRVEAALALWRVTKNDGLVQPLVQIMSDPNAHPAARVGAAQVLSSIGPFAKQAVPALIEALKSPSEGLHGAALAALADIGPDSKDAIPELGRLLQGDKKDDEDEIVRALENIGKPALPALLKSLHAKDGGLRWNVCQALIKVDPETKVPVPDLIEALYVDSNGNGRNAAVVLGGMGSNAMSAIPALAEILGDNGRENHSEVIAALQALGPDPKSIRALKNALECRDPNIRQEAADALGSFGGAGKTAAQALRQALKDPDAIVRASAAIALWRVEGDKKPALPVLKELTRGKYAKASVIAAKGLWEMDQDENGLHFLVAALQDDDGTVQRSAGMALKGLGADARVIAPKLIKLLETSDSYASSLAGDALIEIDPKAAVKAGLTLPEKVDPLPAIRKRERFFFPFCGMNRDRSDEPTEDIDMKSGKVLPHPPPRIIKPEDLP